MKVYYFGCWNRAGHFLHAPGGHTVWDQQIERYSHGAHHLDGTLAPRRMKRGGALCWEGQGETDAESKRIRYDAEELPQGQFLRHVLDNGFTALAWWDRCQGDERGACNSVFLLEGEHDAPTMLAALREHFPHVVANLERHGVALVEVTA